MFIMFCKRFQYLEKKKIARLQTKSVLFKTFYYQGRISTKDVKYSLLTLYLHTIPEGVTNST